jgi:hypothetical protein
MKSAFRSIVPWNPQCFPLPHEIHCSFHYLMKSTMRSITSWNPLRIPLPHEIQSIGWCICTYGFYSLLVASSVGCRWCHWWFTTKKWISSYLVTS